MSDGQYPPLTDSTDDLPRTLRRERESRERAAREMQARTAQSGAQSAERTSLGSRRQQSGRASLDLRV